VTAAGVAGTCIIAGTTSRAFIAPRVSQAPVASAELPGAASSDGPSSTVGAFYATGAVGLAIAAAGRSGVSARSGRRNLHTRSAEPASAAEAPPPFNPAVQVGAMAPLGFFDPAGFCKEGDEAGFRNLRAAEIKHGRVAMMASIGAVAQHYIKFPGFDSVPSGLLALADAPGIIGMFLIVCAAGVLELGAWKENPSREPGNFGDPFNVGMYDVEMRSRELNNGRFAMFATFGIISAELLTGKDAMQQLGF